MAKNTKKGSSSDKGQQYLKTREREARAYKRSLPKGADRAERVQRSRGKTRLNEHPLNGQYTHNQIGLERISKRNQAAGLKRVAPYKDSVRKADKARAKRERRGDAGSRRRGGQS
jgi:hypothetical protein